MTDLSGSRDLSGVLLEEEGESMWGIRRRILTSDLSGNIPLQTGIQEVVEYKASKLNDLYLQSIVFLIRFFNMSSECLQALWLLLRSIVKGVKRGVTENIYVFFEGSSYPYYLDDIQMASPAIPSVEWYYNAKTHTFISARLYNNSQQYHTHHIPYLAAEVKYNDLLLYDISDFIDSVRWGGEEDEGMPNADHLVSAWTLSSGIVLKRSDAMTLSVINTDGDDMRVPLKAA